RKLSDSASVNPLRSSVREVSGSIAPRLFGFGYDWLLLLEAITHAMFGQDVRWICCVWFDFAPELADINARIIDVVNVFAPPHLLQQITLRHNPSGILHQYRQQLEFGRGEVDLPVVDVDMAAVKIDIEVAVIIALFRLRCGK